MAKSANEKLLDRSVRHQIGIERYKASLNKDLLRLLDKAERDILARLDRVPEGRWTSKRLDRLLQSVRDISNEAHVAMGKEVRPQLRDLAKREAEWAQKTVADVLPGQIGLDVVTPDAETLNQLVINDPFRGKIMREWTRELSDATFRGVRDAVKIGMVEGESNPQIANRLRRVMKTSRHRAETWARTAVNHVSNGAREATFAKNKRVVKKVQWVSTLDTKTSSICRQRDGRTYEVGQGPRPPAHPNCRSTVVPILRSWRELGIDAKELPESTRASMNGQVPEKMNYNGWLRSQVQEGRMDVVRDALGPKRAKLFAAGGLDVTDFNDSRGGLLTLDQLFNQREELFRRLDVQP